MTRRILVAAVNAMAALANRIITRPEVPTEQVPDSWPLTDEEMRDYQATWSACVIEAVEARADFHHVDFGLWRAEYMARGEQS